MERVEVKDVRVPEQLQRAMAAEAEAAREGRAKVIAAEGEHKASRALKHAAEVITEDPAALQVRTYRGFLIDVKFCVPAEISANTGEYLTREQQHYCLPHTHRYHRRHGEGTTKVCPSTFT